MEEECCMSKDIQIVPMLSEEDMDGKGYVHWKSWQEAYAGIVDPAYLAAMSPEKCASLARRWPDNTLVAKTGGRVVGFSCWGSDKEQGVVFALYILSEYYGKGLGYALMNAAMEQLKEYGSVALWVLKDNTRAVNFYKRYGFKPDGAEQEIVLGCPVTEMRMVYKRNGK